MKEMYETIMIFNINTDYKSSISKINTLCQTFTGDEYEIDTDEMGIKNLAYEVKGQKKGYYYKITWMGDKNNLIDLETILREDDNTILRFITISMTDEDDDIRLKPKECEQKKPVIDLLDIIYNL